MGFHHWWMWGLETVLLSAVLFAVQIPLRRKKHPVLRTAVFLLKLLLVPGMALLFVAIESKAAYRSGDWVTAAYLALLGDTAASVAEYLFRRWPRKKKTECPCFLVLCGALAFVFTFSVLFYGSWNASRVTVTKRTWTAQGLKTAHTFAFAADLHAGSAQSGDTLLDMCRQINAAKPEFVVLGGDITDELSSREDMLGVYGILSTIESPVYFVYGNHDRQPKAEYTGGRTYKDGELIEAIEGAGIRILKDEYVRIAEDLILLGREDLSREERLPWAELAGSYEGEGALIVADHEPYDTEQLAAEVSALQVSGHTHAGQLWPLRLVYRILGLPAYGEFREPGTVLWVSAGASGWMMPLRTEKQCSWELITLIPEG